MAAVPGAEPRRVRARRRAGPRHAPGAPDAAWPNGAVGVPPMRAAAVKPPMTPPPAAPILPRLSRSRRRRKPTANRAKAARSPKAAKAGDGLAGLDDDFDDESNLSLSAMEAALKPQVLATLDQIAGPLQEARQAAGRPVEAALGADELSTSQERRFNKLRNETVDLVKIAAAQQQPHRSAGRPDVRHQPPAAVARRQAAAPGRSARRRSRGFPQAISRQRARSQLGAPRRPSDRPRLEGFRARREATRSSDLRDEIQTLAQETRQSISDFRRIVQTVQKGERESASGEEGNDRGEPAPRDLDRQEIHQSRPAIPRPDPGRQYRPDEGGR